MRTNEQGFTIVELISVLSVTGIFVGLIMFFTFSYWRYGFLMEADLDTFVTRLNAGDYLRESFGTSSGLIIQNSIPDSNVNNPDTTITPAHYWVPLHAIPGTKNIGSSGTTTPFLYFNRLSVDTSGNIIMNGIQPYEDQYVLYLNGTTKQLLIRSLANPNAPGNRLQTSCPPETATASCPADKVIASDLASVEVRYFSRTGNLIDYTSSVDSDGNYNGPDFPTVDVLEVTLNITKKPIFQKTNATQNKTTVRIALRNR
jgi:hypothetical protein